jgi:hypothetical protein
MRDGKVAKRTDLTAAVRQQVLPDFKKSRAKRYNDYYDFIFDSEDREVVVDSETLSERGWDLDDAGHVVIDCTCTTDPKELEPHRWTVRFKGTWDIQGGKFIQQKLTRVPFRPNQPAGHLMPRFDLMKQFLMFATLASVYPPQGPAVAQLIHIRPQIFDEYPSQPRKYT